MVVFDHMGDVLHASFLIEEVPYNRFTIGFQIVHNLVTADHQEIQCIIFP